MRTRTKPIGKTSSKTQEATQTLAAQPKTLEASVTVPPSLFILPKNLSTDARIICVPSPANKRAQTRLLLCPVNGFYEFTLISSSSGPHSWLLTPAESPDNVSRTDGYVLKQSSYLIATPLDPLFLALQLIVASNDYQQSYLAFSDYAFSTDLEGHEQLQYLLRQRTFTELSKRLEHAMAAICTSISLGDDEQLYRLSLEKLCQLLLTRAMSIASSSLPQSMEDRFVLEPSQVPDSQLNIDEIVEEGAQQDSAVSSESFATTTSQNSAYSVESIVSASTTATSVEDEPSSKPVDSIKHLLRARTVWEYMLRSYVSKSLHDQLRKSFAEQTTLNFKPLFEHEERVNAAKQQIQALRTLSDNINRKRTIDDDEAAAKADEKRRKKDEEDQRKKSVSQGVKKLLKADTSGMKKMSSFFTKAQKK